MSEPKSEINALFVTTTSTPTSSQNGQSATCLTSSATVAGGQSATATVNDGSAQTVTSATQSQQQQANTQVITEASVAVLQQLNGCTTATTNGPGPGLQKVVLEDIRLEDYYNETMEESLCKQFKFQITHNELKMMIENSVLETNTAKPYRYLTGNFIRVFERHVEVFEKQKIPIQKRNNVVYEESLRNNTVYMRINGDCKLCPKANRVRYVFIIKQKPDPDDKYVEVEAKIRGTHVHDASLGNTSLDSLGSTSNTPIAKTAHHSTARKHTQRLSLSMLNSAASAGADGSTGAVDDKAMVLASVMAATQPTPPSAKRPRLNKLDTTTTQIQLDPQLTTTNTNAYLSTSPKSGNNNNAQQYATAAAVNLLDKNFINQITNQISSKIMIKLDQINLKVNQISDRLYDLERKLDSVEVAEIQF